MAAIANFFQSFLDWFKSLFWKQEMELTLVGLQVLLLSFVWCKTSSFKFLTIIYHRIRANQRL